MIKKRLVSSFFEEEYKQQAANNNYQKIASYVDGLKPTARKVIHTVIKNNLTSWTKVEVLANKTAGETEYLGGSSNISGVITTISKGYVTSNNIPMLDTMGNFGQRLDNKPGEPRYIKVRKGNILEDYFSKVDNNILIVQEFEETIIEPRFFVPNLPFILLNGSMGALGTGHAQEILPRDINDIKLYINNYINDIPNSPLKPYWNNFRGIIKQGETYNKWITEGLYKVNKRQITVYELPVGYSLLSYTKKLDILVDKKVIRSYIDESNTKTDKFMFIIKVDTKFKLEHENILDKLKLTSKFSENYTVMDENNSIKVFDNSSDLLDSYIKIKLKYLGLRKEYIINKIKDDLAIMVSKYTFINLIIDNKLIINKRKKNEIILELEELPDIIKINNSYDYLLNTPIYNLTQEKIDNIYDNIKLKKEELLNVTNQSIEVMWLEDIKKIG